MMKKQNESNQPSAEQVEIQQLKEEAKQLKIAIELLKKIDREQT